MPFYKEISFENKASLFLWKIEEPLNFFLENVSLTKASKERLNNMKSEQHKKGFLAVRMLLKYISFYDDNLLYDNSGKPYLIENNLNDNHKINISISHSHELSGILISKSLPIGLDIEVVKPKILAIAPKFMDVFYLNNLNEKQKEIKATIIWCIKESIFKIKNQKGISFLKHISEKDFNLLDNKTKAYLNFNNTKESFTVYFDTFEGYACVCAFPKP